MKTDDPSGDTGPKSALTATQWLNSYSLRWDHGALTDYYKLCRHYYALRLSPLLTDIKSLKKSAMESNNALMSAGKPKHGPLAGIRKMTNTPTN